MPRTLTTAAITAAGLLAMIASADAGPIASGSTLSLDGVDKFTADAISFDAPISIGAVSVSFDAIGTCIGCVSMNAFDSSSTDFLVYSAKNKGVTTTLTLDSATFTEVPSIGGFVTLTISGMGTETMTGFDPTPVVYSLTTQGWNGDGEEDKFTFSSTTAAPGDVPEPSSLLILGAGLIGLGWFARRCQNSITA